MLPLGELLPPAPGCATPRDEPWRRLPPCWLCASLHAERWPANGEAAELEVQLDGLVGRLAPELLDAAVYRLVAAVSRASRM
jgi:hypothetical protein